MARIKDELFQPRGGAVYVSDGSVELTNGTVYLLPTTYYLPTTFYPIYLPGTSS